jgi:hypothetical protein
MAAGITQAVLDNVSDIKVMVARVEERQIRQDDNITELMKVTIKGNGKLPLTERMANVEACLKTDAEAKAEKKKTKEKWDLRTWAIVMLFISQVVILVFK